MDSLTARGPYNNDVYVPLATLPFLPNGGTVSHFRDYAYISLADENGIERALQAYFIGPNGHGYRVSQSVSYSGGNPEHPDTERIPETLDGQVDDLGPLNGTQLDALIRSGFPGLSP
ncbi:MULTISPECIES: hypothetical protein [Mycolicibacter]|uniref:Uncharacterized protein n=2 Tax=Mycolicibacter TaxID=1073531 RepID=A0ABU5XQL6_9MYCO|nr:MULTISPECIES: hypothetical protein [unclassified Mycolicibacter]MEB3023381.1 hypothetical protein [Mycolicibacter sp. MYC098]MEB3033723.1 hypothetical protein [Mycolicibacter sp. MYC340]